MSTWRPITPPPFWQRWLPNWLHGLVRLLFQLSIIGVIILSVIIFFYFMLAMKFNLDEVAKLPPGTTFYDRKGIEITAPGGQGHQLVKMPDFLNTMASTFVVFCVPRFETSRIAILRKVHPP